jgi:XapX domain-containing protein
MFRTATICCNGITRKSEGPPVLTSDGSAAPGPYTGAITIEGNSMKMYIVSIAVGLLVGLIYGFLNVRSPAPPVIALVGLLGMLVGEQLPPLLRQLWQPDAPKVSWIEDHVKPHCFGQLPSAIKVDDEKRSS